MRIDRVLANNPGPFTGPGTNTWVLGDDSDQVVIIDPGPVDTKHANAIFDVVGKRTLEAVLVTHTHPDHAPMANPIARDIGVPAVGYGRGPQFDPDIRLLDGAVFDVGTLVLEVIHTPGHSHDHLCFRVENVVFSGDHIIGGSSVMVDDMGSYLRSLERLRGKGIEVLHPGHGDTMGDPDDVIDWYVQHRRQRHEEIFSAILKGARSVSDIVEVVYTDVDSSLHPLAARSVAAHLSLLSEEHRIVLEDDRVVVISQAP